MNTEEKIKIMQSWIVGKTIRWIDQNGCHGEMNCQNDAEPLWNWEDYRYFIKPEPMELEVWVDKNGKPIDLANELNGKGCAAFARMNQGDQVKKFREIL